MISNERDSNISKIGSTLSNEYIITKSDIKNE